MGVLLLTGGYRSNGSHRDDTYITSKSDPYHTDLYDTVSCSRWSEVASRLSAIEVTVEVGSSGVDEDGSTLLLDLVGSAKR
jgi:hypothetical protein